MVLYVFDAVFDAVGSIIKNSVCFGRLEKQRKKLQKENLLKDLRDEKDERLEKVHEYKYKYKS